MVEIVTMGYFYFMLVTPKYSFCSEIPIYDYGTINLDRFKCNSKLEQVQNKIRGINETMKLSTT